MPKTLSDCRKRIKRWWLAPTYFLIIILLMPASLTYQYKLGFLLYSVVIFGAIFFILRQKNDNDSSGTEQKTDAKTKNFYIYLLIFSIIALTVSRLSPFVRFGIAPLGYDTGFYLNAFQSYYYGAEAYAPYYLNLLPYFFTGVPPLIALYIIYFLSQLMIAGSLYFFFHTPQIKNHLPLAAISIFLFVASVTQFQAYWWMFGQQLMAIAFLIITISLILRYSRLAILTCILGLLIHPPTFIILFIALFVYFLISAIQILFGKKSIKANLIIPFVAFLAVCLAIIVLKFHYFYGLFELYIFQFKGLATNFPFYEVQKMKGLFISPENFYLNSFLLIPFAIIGFLYPKAWPFLPRNKDGNINFLTAIYIVIIGLFILITVPFIYQHRFLIIFDLFLIIFATPVFAIFVNYFIHDQLGKLILIIFLLAFGLKTGLAIYQQVPQISKQELTEIQSYKQKIEPNALILLTSSTYTPWLTGFSNFRIISPGFDGDYWNLNKWITFWDGDSNEERYKLLDVYPAAFDDRPLYIFIGNRENPARAYQKFIRENQRFTPVGSHLWKYNARTN